MTMHHRILSVAVTLILLGFLGSAPAEAQAASGGRTEQPADSTLVAQIRAPVFTSELLEITAARLSALERSILPQRVTAEISSEELQAKVRNAKTAREVERIVAEAQRAGIAAANASLGNAQLDEAVSAAAEAYKEVVRATREWRKCVSAAGVQEELRLGVGNVSTNAQLRERVAAVTAAETKACGAQPVFPESPAPPQSWTEGARAFYRTIDRALGFCNSDVLHVAPDRTIGVDLGDDYRVDFSYTAAEAAVLRDRCDDLVDVLSQTRFHG